ncbi:hypothetical protein [Agromyces sp. NPDC055661]
MGEADVSVCFCERAPADLPEGLGSRFSSVRFRSMFVGTDYDQWINS